MSECKICEDTGEITVSSYIKKDGEVIPMIVAPCSHCKKRKENDG